MTVEANAARAPHNAWVAPGRHWRQGVSALALGCVVLAGALAIDACQVLSAAERASNPRPQAAAVPPAVSLSELYDIAMGGNPGLSAASSRAKAADIGVDNARFGFAPRANVIGDAERERQEVLTTDNPVYQVGTGKFNNYRTSVQIDQPLLDYRLFAKLDVAVAAAKQAAYSETSAQQKLTYDLIEAYVLALASEDSRALAEAESRVLEQHTAVVRQRIASGMANDGDISQVASRRDQAQADAIMAASAVRQAFGAIERLTHSPVQALWRLRAAVPVAKPVPATPELWIANSESNPEILAMSEAVEQASAAYEQAKGAILPHLDFRGSYNYNNNGGSLYGGGARTNDAVATLRLTVPLFNSDGQGYQMAEQRVRVAESRYALQDRKLALGQKVRAVLSDAIAGADRTAALSSAASNSARHLEALREKFRGGTGTVTEILDAESEYFRVKRQLLQAKYNYLLSMMQLRQYSGVISRADVEYVDSLLDRRVRPIRAF